MVACFKSLKKIHLQLWMTMTLCQEFPCWQHWKMWPLVFSSCSNKFSCQYQRIQTNGTHHTINLLRSKFILGSMMTILTKVEELLRSQAYHTWGRYNMQMITNDAMKELEDLPLFPCHLEHRHKLAEVIVKRYIRLRFYKSLKDDRVDPDKGHYLHRSRIFQNC